MKISVFGRKWDLVFVMGALLFFAMLVPSADAQTKKKKKKVTRKPVTVAVVPPVTIPGDAQIVSRADDYLTDDSQADLQSTDPQVSATPETTDDRLDKTNRRVKDMNSRLKSLEGSKPTEYDEKQKRLALNLDILTKAEQRSESLRKQLYEMIEKETNIKTKLDRIDSDIRPETIEREVAMAGTLRPEELRDMKRKSLEVDRKNLNDLLVQIRATRANLELNVQRADLMVEKLRSKLEKDIDDALTDEPKNPE